MKEPIVNIGLVLVLAALTANVFFGSIGLTVAGILDGDVMQSRILTLRLLRAAEVAIVGVCLATSGSVLQKLLRNPLADPYILGVSAGGTVGAALGVILRLPFFFFGLPVRFFCVLFGCAGVMFVLIAVRKRLRRLSDEYAIPLVGIIINAFLSAALMCVTALASPSELYEVQRWLLGAVQTLDETILFFAAVVMLLAVVWLWRAAPLLDLLALGDPVARASGVDVEKYRTRLILLTGVLVACSVTIAGAIGFIGIIVPHLTRQWELESSRRELLSNGVLGAFVLLSADFAARVLFAPIELPMGVFVACLGAPALLFLLVKRSQQRASL